VRPALAITLRRARPDEPEALGDLGFAAWQASAFAVNDAGRVDRGRLRGEFRGFGATHAATILVAEAGGRLLGWGAREHQDQLISDLWVAPEAQGRGVGGALLAALIAEIAAAGHLSAELETLASNAQAVGFYRRHGFVVAWRAEKFSQALGYAIDKVGMTKTLGTSGP
jgi:ribosomal-protein-alanine N-acetyltransferase